MKVSTKNAFVVWVNSDLTEGRGYDLPIVVSEYYSTAIRLAKGRNVQGSDGRIQETELYLIDGKWCGPVYINPPSKTDLLEESRFQLKNAALKKAKEAGLTQEDINALIHE